MPRTTELLAALVLLAGVAGCGAALMEKSQRGDLQSVRQALLRGGDVNARTVQGHSALTLAAREGHLDVVNALIRAGAELDIRAWTLGARAGTYESARLFPALQGTVRECRQFRAPVQVYGGTYPQSFQLGVARWKNGVDACRAARSRRYRQSPDPGGRERACDQRGRDYDPPPSIVSGLSRLSGVKEPAAFGRGRG